MRGAFILLEGLDRSGKSTQSRKLQEYFRTKGIKTKVYGFPNRTTPIGKQINEYLQKQSDKEAHFIHLLFSANRWEQKDSIIKDLQDGYTIICDRYFASGVAFSSAKGLDMEWCLSPDRGLPQPDLIFFLNVNEDEQKQREGYGDERYEKLEFQLKVKQQFLKLKDKLSYMNWKWIDGSRPIEDVFDELKDIVDKTIVEVQDKPIAFIYIYLL